MNDDIKTKTQFAKLLIAEVTDSNILVLEVQYIKEKIHITGGFNLEINPFEDIKKTILLLKQNLNNSKIKTKNCVVGLSMQYFKFLPVTIPQTIPADEIPIILSQEANIDQTLDTLSWLVLNNTIREEADGVKRYDVLSISTKKNLIHAISQIFKQSTLNVVCLTPLFLGLSSFLTTEISTNLISTLYISKTNSELVIWSGKEPIYEHVFLTNELSQKLLQTLNFILAQLPGSKIETIFISGPFSKQLNLSELPYVLKEFPFPSDFTDQSKILEKFSFTNIVGLLGIASTYLTNLNSLPNLTKIKSPKIPSFQNLFKDIQKKNISQIINFPNPFTKYQKNIDPQISKFILPLVVVLFLSIVSYAFIKSFLLPSVISNNSNYESRLSLAQAHLAKVMDYEKTNKVFKTKSDYLSKLIERRTPWSALLREIADITPKNLWIDRLEIKNKKVDIFGRALDVDSVANFSINLNYNSNYVGQAQIINLRKYKEEDIDFIEYQITSYVKDKANANTSKLDKSKQPDIKT